MIVEAAVFGRERRLDQAVGEVLERDRVVVFDAAAADRIVVAVEEGHRQIRLLQPVLVGGLAEGRDGERQHQDAAGKADGRHLRQRLDEDPALPAPDIEAIHERRIALIEFAQAAARGEQRGIETRIEIQKEIPDPLHPLAGYDLAHQNFLNRRSHPWSARTLAAATAQPNMRVRLRHPRGDGEGNHRREEPVGPFRASMPAPERRSRETA